MKQRFTLLYFLLVVAVAVTAQTPLIVKVYGKTGAKYRYGKMYVPQGEKYRIAVHPSANATVGVYRAYNDDADIYLSSVDAQGGYYWIDATETAHQLIVRSTCDDDIVAEVMTAEDEKLMDEEGYYFYDKSDSRKNKLRYNTSKVANQTLLTSSTYNSKSIYVMANPAKRGLCFALLNPVSSSRDLPAGSLYILLPPTVLSPELNIVWEDDEPDEAFTPDDMLQTGVSTVSADLPDDAPAYTLDGRRSTAYDRSGLLVRQGRKYVVKR